MFSKDLQDPLACAKSGNAKVLEGLLKDRDEEGLKNIRDRDGNSILSTAAFYGHRECCKVIMVKCPSLLHDTNNEGCTALHHAASENKTDTLRKLLEAAPKNDDVEGKKLLTMIDKEGCTALHSAARGGHDGAMNVLIKADNGGDLLMATDSQHRTALHLAAQNGHVKTVEKLIKADHDGELLTMTDNETHTALHLAAQSGHEKVVNLLTEAKHDVNGKLLSMVDKNEDTAMHLAVKMQKKEIVEILAKKKPDLEYSANRFGQTPHFIAFEKAVSGVPTAEPIKKIILKLPERVNEQGQNFLHILSSTSKHDEEEYSLGLKDIDRKILNKQDQKGNTPLHIAVKNVNDNLAKALLHNKDVDKTIKNDDGDIANTTHLFIAEIYDKQVKGQADVDLVVATLIATVSFAAGIAVPGGYTGEGSNIGTAILTPKTSFKVFMVSDVIALLLSLYAVLSHLAAKHIREEELLLYQVKIARCCSILAIFAMVAAFASGVYTVLAVSDEFASILCALSSGFGLLGLLPLFRIRGRIWEKSIRPLYDYVKNFFLYTIWENSIRPLYDYVKNFFLYTIGGRLGAQRELPHKQT